MDTRHLRAHLQELIGRRQFLATLKPDSDRYKLWLGDVVELVNVAYGAESEEMGELRGALTGRARPPATAGKIEREREYLARLEALGGVLERLARRIPEPLPSIETDGNQR